MMSNAPSSNQLPPLPLASSGGGALFSFRSVRTNIGPLLSLVVVILFFAMADELWGSRTFVSVRNLRTILVQTSPVAVAALGMTVIIISGGIDLSAGTAMALSATVLAYALREGYSVPIAIGTGVAVGGLMGMLNGSLIALLRVVPFVVTLGTMTIYLGMAKLLADETTIRPALNQIPDWLPQLVATRPVDGQFLTLGLLILVVNGAVLLIVQCLRTVVIAWREHENLGWAVALFPGFIAYYQLTRWETCRRPALLSVTAAAMLQLGMLLHGYYPNLASSGVTIALELAIVLAVVLKFTVFGRHVFALGSNESTARLCGVNVPMTKIAVYALAGLFVGAAGMYQFARLSTGNPTSGLGLELKIIAAVVIGGGSLSGGQGTVVGTLTGAAIMGVIASGCGSLGLRNPVQDVIIGVVIVAAAAIDQFRQRRMAT